MEFSVEVELRTHYYLKLVNYIKKYQMLSSWDKRGFKPNYHHNKFELTIGIHKKNAI